MMADARTACRHPPLDHSPRATNRSGRFRTTARLGPGLLSGASADDVCRCCGQARSGTHVLDVRSTDTPDRFAIERCASCGVLQTLPVPADLTPYYATDLAATMTRSGSRFFAGLRRLRLLGEVARLRRDGHPGTVLDVGCGAGDFARVMARDGLAVIAADAGSAAPAALRDAPVPYARFDFETYAVDGLDGRPPAMVVLRHVLEHVRDPYGCLTSLRRQGARRIYIVVPNAASLQRWLLGAHWYLWDPPRHLWHFDRPSLERVCTRAGFTTVDRGYDTTSALTPTLYRWLRLRGAPAWLYDRCGPTSALAAVAAPLDRFVPGNVLWLLARA